MRKMMGSLLVLVLCALAAWAEENEAWVCPSRNTCYNGYTDCVISVTIQEGTGGNFSRCDALLEACLGGEYCMPVY